MNNRILKLTVENFRSFNSSQTLDFSKNHISCFVGHNGSGKSNLLLAIIKLRDLFLSRGESNRPFDVSFDRRNIPTNLSMEFLAGGNKYTYIIEGTAANDTILKEELRDENNNPVGDFNRAEEFFQSVIFFRRQENFSYEKEIYINEEIKKPVLNFMNRLGYEIEDIAVEKINGGCRTLLKRPYFKNPVSIETESKGVRRLIELLTMLYAKKDGIILVDELETGFHELLVLSLIKEVNANVNQFIFTSHLLELLTRDCLSVEQLFSVVKENGESVIYPVSEIEGIEGSRFSLKSLYRAGKIPGYPEREE